MTLKKPFLRTNYEVVQAARQSLTQPSITFWQVGKQATADVVDSIQKRIQQKTS